MVVSRLDALSRRPPTPPKDVHDHEQAANEAIDDFLQDPFGVHTALPTTRAPAPNPLNTPEPSPASDSSIPSSSASRRKRVNFELQTCTLPPGKALAQSWTPTRSSPLRALPQTRVSRPLKSILKPADETATPPPADQGAAAHQFKTFADMLESVVKMLASAERPSRIDAYHALQRTMQAYDKIPDDDALKRNMSLLTGFVRRDMQAPSPTGPGLDSQLIGQSLKLLMALFRIPEAAAAMDDDFCTHLLDRSIHVAADAAMPKLVVNTHLAVLMQQNFRPKIMNNARLDKILDALDTIHERVGGFSVQAYRIRIYRKLIQQRPDAMPKHTERWFRFALRAFVANQKDITQSALDIALSAAKSIGHDLHVAKSCLAVLNRVKNHGDTLATVLTKELENMLGGDNACLVPQIWAAVTVLLQKSLQPNAFSSLKEWLELFDKCIASPKDQVRVQANVAFCFLLYSVNISHDTSEDWAHRFVKTPLNQLQRRLPAKKEERNAVSSGYLTLLYYSFPPTASHAQLDRCFREFVIGFWAELLKLPGHMHAFAACRIVSALLNGSRKPWNAQRALDQRPQCMVQHRELPLLDPKWVRRSLPMILEFVDTLLEATPWPDKEQQEDEPVKTMWLAVLASLVEASSKEVMASSETKEAMAHIVNLLRRVWDRHTAQLALSQQTEDNWAKKFCFLIETVVQKLGASHFADKFLTRNGSDEFEVASTPSHRARQHGTRISPLLYFIDLLVNQSEGKLPDAVRQHALHLILEPCFNAQNTRLGRLELLRGCSSTIDSSPQTPVASNFWALVGACLHASLQEQKLDTNDQGSRSLGKEYDIVVELLGLGHFYFLNTPQGHDTLLTFIKIIRKEAGDSAVGLAAVEKVSERVLKPRTREEMVSCLPYITILLRNLPPQTSRRSLEQGRQNLWPSSPAAGRQADFDPYVHLYGAIVNIGTAAYRIVGNEDGPAIGEFLAALATSIKDCTTSHLAVYLRKTQDVIRIWVEDVDRKMQSKEQLMKALQGEVLKLWTEVTNAIERLPRKDVQILLHLEPLITAGFVSRRQSIVNASIATWNKTFGLEGSLRYPPRLEGALRRLRPIVELTLPSWDMRYEDAADEASFYESDASADEIRPGFKSPRVVKESPFNITKSTRRSLSRSPAVPTSAGRRSSARQTPKVRLRHDNSQIQFEPIVSSPSNPFNQESQVLTERQKEMLERQHLSSGLFANMGAPSPQPAAATSPTEFHSDALMADDLPMTASRITPRKALADMGPMDAFLGSSPTPHARRSTGQIISDDTNLATPTARRTLKVAENEEPGSSPPRFEKSDNLEVARLNSDVLVGSSFEYRQRDNTSDDSFDEGTTIDEDALLNAVANHPEDFDQVEDEPIADIIMSDVPSATIDLQLKAQLDADIRAHTAAVDPDTDKAAAESNNDFVDAASQLQSGETHNDEAGSDTEVDESQPQSPAPASRKHDQDGASSTSHVGDSFNKASSTKSTPQSQSVRRSFRHTTTPSPLLSLGTKRRNSTSVKLAMQPKNTMLAEVKGSIPPRPTAAVEDPQLPQPDKDGMLDNIVVASPVKRVGSNKKRKSAGDTQVVVPETHCKRAPVRRSQSSLSQVENSQDFVVEDTPAPKRARKTATQDVSEAKTRRLSHVQVTPKRSPEAKHGTSVAEATPAVEASEVTSTTPREQTTRPPAGNATPSRSFTERVILTPRSIINQLKSLKDYLFNTPQLVIQRGDEREMDDLMFDIRRGMHAAGRRGDDTHQA
ncbi:Rap1-interacting factor 1 N terminal-domain-containing protein [Ampelomyces quisqualis]|uniref:Rap1-interacting factor 1 N terminal-domain-containing protein n=1 Tax=Ampelomyces quisqualis TaxID=50730 RepID=A0A6A5Q993_AMPQU|nr:Rap1-interacting factor 1 N terminal-domain-containing protein [Ampelomyces quisqualis]